ncbi:response regulator transcription factor [Anaerotalea alkaliphila]|uniref:Stage 0 sporulation protein A homolog n=1 Tax=Anaerotalea alkaliphila TaxID=2662126 RepID=A0A7X5HUE2_9FIRM|nr:response regulator transcription factor [Anaerotalea alkaliphila]NDL66832.1 response regulator transcription factor [Anaerotalea alkaliphila]
MEKPQILIVDDDPLVRRMVRTALEYENLSVAEAASGAEAKQRMQGTSYDLVLLDVMLGTESGLDVLRQLHEIDPMVPIVILSGRGAEYDKILGLGIGADDYITKPFSPVELSARIKAHLRRNLRLMGTGKGGGVLRCGVFTFDPESYKVYKEDRELQLSSKELKLLKFFLEHPNQVFTKNQLYENVWNDAVIDDNSIMVYISHLRKKIEEQPQTPRHLKTVWGIGYTFDPQ